MLGCENPVHAASKLEVDLWAGDVRESATARIVARLSSMRPDKPARWILRERVIATEAFLASGLGSPGLGLFEMAVLWPKWLRHATYFQDIRDMFNPARWAMNNALRPYGWQLDEVGRMCWAVRPDDGAANHAVIKAGGAIEHLRAASKALDGRDYATVMSSAIEALGHCGDSLHARLLIGFCRFCFQQAVDDEIAIETAKRVLDHEESLRLACNMLLILRRREASRSPHRWAFVEEFICRFEQQLEVYYEMFEKARAFLYGE